MNKPKQSTLWRKDCSESAHGAMLRGELCNQIFVSFDAPGAPQIAAFTRGRAVHIHQQCNHMGISPHRFGSQFVIISLN